MTIDLSPGYIVFEGIDGSGKTTLINYACEHLTELGVEHIRVREPGGTEFGQKIRNALLEREPSGRVGKAEVGTYAELLAMFTDRVNLLETIIIPSLLNGIPVLSDRSYISTFAYQGWGKNIPPKEIAHFLHRLYWNIAHHENVMRQVSLSPVYVKELLFCYLPVNVARDRISKVPEKQKYYEKLGDTFLVDVVNGYFNFINTFAELEDFPKMNVKYIDTSQALEVSKKDLRDYFQHHLLPRIGEWRRNILT